MTEQPKVPTLAEIKANLLEVRNHTQFNIGSPAAIDHLLISIVSVIDAIQATPQHRMGRGPVRDTTKMRIAQQKRRERESSSQSHMGGRKA